MKQLHQLPKKTKKKNNNYLSRLNTQWCFNMIDVPLEVMHDGIKKTNKHLLLFDLLLLCLFPVFQRRHWVVYLAPPEKSCQAPKQYFISHLHTNWRSLKDVTVTLGGGQEIKTTGSGFKGWPSWKSSTRICCQLSFSYYNLGICKAFHVKGTREKVPKG